MKVADDNVSSFDEWKKPYFKSTSPPFQFESARLAAGQNPIDR